MVVVGTGTKKDPILLEKLVGDEVPEELRIKTYFDFEKYPFEHKALFDDSKNVVDVLGKIGDYSKKWLNETIEERRVSKKPQTKVFKHVGLEAELTEENIGKRFIGSYEVLVEDGAIFRPGRIVGNLKNDGKLHRIYVAKGAQVYGEEINLENGDIYIGEGSKVRASYIGGSTIIGKNNTINPGAKLREKIVIGDGCTLGGELKNTVIMNGVQKPHFSYAGDSILGAYSHFGDRVTAANYEIFQLLRDTAKNIGIEIKGKYYDAGTTKMGVILGDRSQIGCGSVTAPGTLIGKESVFTALVPFEPKVFGEHTFIRYAPMDELVQAGVLKPGNVDLARLNN